MSGYERTDALAERFRVAVETLFDCFGEFAAVRDASGVIADFRIDYLNEAACRNNGRPLEEQVGRGLLELLPAHRESGLFEAYCRVVESGVPLQLEMEAYSELDRGGRRSRWFDIRAAKSGDGFVAAWREVTDLRREIEASRTYESLFRCLCDANIVGIGVGNARGEVQFVNDEMLRMMGYSRADFDAGRVDWAGSLTAESLAEALAGLGELQRRRGASGYEREFQRPDGGRTPFIGAAALMPDGDTHVSIALDLSEKRRADAARAESEARLRLAVKASGTGIWDWNVVTGEVKWSEETFTIHGLASDEFRGTAEAFGELVHPDDLERVWATVSGAIAARTPYAAEFRIVRPDGVVRWVLNSGQAFYDGDGRPLRMLGTINDVTGRKKIEEALRRSEERLRVAKTAARLGIHDYDIASGRIEWDERVRELWGVGRDEAITYETFLAGVHPDDRNAMLAAVECAFDPAGSGRYFATYRVVSRADRSQRWVEATGRVTFENGQAVRLVGTVLEVTQQRAAEQALREADRRKDEFLATLAHELRNPIAPVRQAAAVARMPNATPAQVRWCLDVIERQTKHMALLLDDLLDVSRITRGRIDLNLRTLVLQEVVEAAVETARPHIEARRHALEVSLPDGLPAIRADYLRMAQVLSNLLTNAAKYTEPGGRIRLSARRDGDAVEIAVADNGIGIAAEHLERVFEMFAQGGAPGPLEEGGLGIGLALARGLVVLHGGAIEARSDGPGRGATFVVRLPLPPREST
jgi:PAS domain S-box-containing protein